VLNIVIDLHKTIVRGTGIESVTACQTARTLSPNLQSPNLCGALDTVHGLPSGGCGDSSAEREFPSTRSIAAMTAGSSGSSPSSRRAWCSSSSTRSWTCGLSLRFQMRVLPIACVVYPTALALLDPVWPDTRALTGHPAGLYPLSRRLRRCWPRCWTIYVPRRRAGTLAAWQWCEQCQLATTLRQPYLAHQGPRVTDRQVGYAIATVRNK
jgi:hypothetical protein